MFKSIAILTIGTFTASGAAWSADAPIRGAGSSAAAPIYQSWTREFQKTGGAALNYDPVGSSAGVKKMRAREVDFGATDVAPSDAELATDGLILLPVAITGITPVFNVPKLGDQSLRMSGEVLARIFLGEITQWNAAEVAALNPGTALPDLPIKVVVRSDGSGTTYNFADYLAKVNPGWKDKMGVKTTLTWPAAFIGVKGSDGVVKAVKETVGAIGYVDFGYTRESRLATLQMKNAEGEFVRASSAAFRTALLNSDWAVKGVFTSTLTQRPGKGVWPITMGTFVVMPQLVDQLEKVNPTVSFFTWALLKGDAAVQDSNFVRLPDRVQGLAFKALSSIKDKAGNRVAVKMF
ncbi:MAG: phosphate ABC transporter substrate-binding protein PstS [Rhodoferax sp.]|nr:phosphate ABC transporter substrate-binding protein PstS [Rhodoferax sp.]